MIAASRTVKLVALALAVGAHGALGLSLFPEARILEEGSGTQETQLGTSFADMAAGTLSAEPATDPVEAETPPETTPPVEPETLASVTPDAPVEALPEETPPPDPLPAETPAEIVTETPVARPEPVQAETPLVPVPEAPAPDAVAALTPTETVAAEPSETVPRQSKRPPEVRPEPKPEPKVVKKPVRTAQKPKPEPRKKPEPKKAPQGNAEQNARQGTTRGTAQSAATRQGSGNAKSTQAGNAAVSNYPGLVNRHLARVRKPSLRRRGVTRVAFSLTSSGGIASVSVARSSGAAPLDEAAVKLIRRAAPFPKPPAGAQRSFSVNIEFR